MTRRLGKEKEEDLSELLQSLDDEVGSHSSAGAAEGGGQSSAGDNYQEPKLEPKHKIFLSHSGDQKDFTEQLCVDLKRWQYYPFFDKESLPKGKEFPRLILQAAQQCQVAVLILSEDFFTRSKWPMLELEAFVEAHKKNPEKIAILPVYFGISREECTKNEARHSEWHLVWREWAEIDNRIDVEKWKEALRVLGPSNGIEYVKFMGEVMLRKEIVNAIRTLVPPENLWSATQFHGRSRVCKAILEKFKRTKPFGVYGTRVVGVYGMGGVGKTTLCKVLCDEWNTKFEGKVCHAELGNLSPLELQKEVLRNLSDINPKSFTLVTSRDTIANLLRQYIPKHGVFLALDNVWQESVEEAKDYLRVGFHYGSMVMVTARSIDILNRLNIDEGDCMEMPELEEEDAKHLFLHHSSPELQFISEDDEQRILHCVRQCKFQRGAWMGEHFHPLALKVLGSQLGSLGSDPKKWVQNLSKGDMFNQFGEKVHPIFSILRRGYDSLSREDQLLFMDGILFYPERSSYGNARICLPSEKVYVDIYEWLSIVHNTSPITIKDRLLGLKAMSLVEDIGDSTRGVIVHDLYYDFAKLEVKRGKLDSRRWVWYKGEYPTDLAESPSGYCWQNVERVSLKREYNYAKLYVEHNHGEKSIQWWNRNMDGIKWQHFSNIVVLQLFINVDEVLNLQGLQCLRSLEVEWDGGDFVEGSSKGKLIGLGKLSGLGWLKLSNIHYSPCFEEIGCLIRLQALWLDSNCGTMCDGYWKRLSPPNLDKCTLLQELVLQQCKCMKALPNVSKLRLLRKIIFDECVSAKKVVGLTSQMCSLRELNLIGCHSLKHVSCLSDLVSLQDLCIIGCGLLQLPDLCKLTNVERMCIEISYQVHLRFSASMKLQNLTVSLFKELHDLHLLWNLQQLVIKNSGEWSVMPQFGNFMLLEELCLHNLLCMHELPDMHNLSNLRRFSIIDAPNLLLHRRSVLGDLVTLQYLCLQWCGTSVGEAELPDLCKLTNLEVLKLNSTPIRSIPSLEHLTRLRILDCSPTKLAKLPDLTGVIPLESIALSMCDELTSLGFLENIPALKHLNVSECYRLERLPDLRSFKRLEYLSLCGSGVRLSSEDILVLGELSVSRVIICQHFELNFPKMLEEMPLTDVVVKIEAEQLEYFATPPIERSYFGSRCIYGCCDW